MKWHLMTRDEKSAHILNGVSRGLSASLIGFEVDASRNAIIGHSHRYGAALRPGNGGKKPKALARRVDPMTGKERATRKYDYSTLTGMARPTIRNVHREPVEGPPIVSRLPMPEKPTTPPVLFRGRRMGFECAFIPGDPKHPLATCCGAPVQGLTEWCPWHLRLVAAA
jgi:hypothetical protein